MKTKNDLELLLSKLPHKIQTRFAYNCCLSIKDLLLDEELKILDVLELWLKDNSKVSNDELRSAAFAATHAADATAYAAFTAAHAAYAAMDNVDATAYAAFAATHAAYAADKNISSYYDMLMGMIKDLTDVEKEMLGI